MIYFSLIIEELDLHRSSVINRVDASTWFVVVKKLGIEEKLLMELACMAMQQLYWNPIKRVQCLMKGQIKSR